MADRVRLDDEAPVQVDGEATLVARGEHLDGKKAKFQVHFSGATFPPGAPPEGPIPVDPPLEAPFQGDLAKATWKRVNCDPKAAQKEIASYPDRS